MQTGRAQLVQRRRCYSSLLSPVRCLLIEIFGKIFVYTTRDRPRHLLNLSAVCRLWRDAALGTSMLWLTLELGHHTTRCNMNNHINSWIERAHSYPLSLVIRKQDDCLDPVSSVITLIPKHQWKSITLDSRRKSILSILKELEFSNLEMLESLSLAPRLCFEFRPTNALRYAPNLKTLSLYILYFVVSLDTLPFPWRQLTILTITLWYSNTGVDTILRACVNLEEFIFHCEGVGRSILGSITLNYLRKLHAHCVDTMFLLSLDTPSIQDLSVTNQKYPPYDLNLKRNIFHYLNKHGVTLLKLFIAPSESRLVRSFPYIRSLCGAQTLRCPLWIWIDDVRDS